MDTIQIAKTLKILLSQGCENEQILNAVVLRVVSSLQESSPSNSALIAAIQRLGGRKNEEDRLRRLGEQLWSDTNTADLRFLRRHPKVSYIYEFTAYWWRSKQILFTCEKERTFRHRVDAEFDHCEPDISSDPKNVYLDKLVYDPKWHRFNVQVIPAISEWWEENVQRPLFQDNILPVGSNCSAIHFPENKIQQLQSLAADIKEWYIQGFPNVTQFRAQPRQKRGA